MTSPSQPTPPPQPLPRAQRFVVSWSAEIKLSPTRTLPVRIVDVSATGLGLVADDAIPSGGLLNLIVKVPAPNNPALIHTVPIQARMIHQVFAGGRNKAGLQIVQVDPAHTRLMTHR